MNAEERLSLLLRNTEETVTEEDLKALLSKKEKPRAYICLLYTSDAADE